MKLLTTGGLLYATVQMQAVNADGSSGTYQNFDWVAMFPEGANGGLAVSTSATNRERRPKAVAELLCQPIRGAEKDG